MMFAEGGEAHLKRTERLSRPARRTSEETRAHIVAVAAAMFYADGIHATGVDALAAKAGIAPTTLYRLFASKDDLVAACIEHCSDHYKQLLAGAVSSGSARERILAVFAAFAQDIGSERRRGCPFLMALAEYPDTGNPVHAVAVGHKAWLRELFHELTAELARTTPLRSPGDLAEQLALVAEGVYGSVQALGSGGPAAQGVALAAALLDAAGAVEARESGTGAGPA